MRKSNYLILIIIALSLMTGKNIFAQEGSYYYTIGTEFHSKNSKCTDIRIRCFKTEDMLCDKEMKYQKSQYWEYLKETYDAEYFYKDNKVAKFNDALRIFGPYKSCDEALKNSCSRYGYEKYDNETIKLLGCINTCYYDQGFKYKSCSMENIKKGNTELAKNKFDEAISFYEEALECDCGSKADEINEKIENAQKAKTDYAKKQLEIKRNNFEKNVSNGKNSFNSKDFLSAQSYFENAAKLFALDTTCVRMLNQSKKENYKYYVEKGDNEFKIGNFSKALENYNLAKSILPNEKGLSTKINNANYGFNIEKGKGEMAAKQYEAAKQSFEKALQYHPNDATANKYLEQVNNLIKENQVIQLQSEIKKYKKSIPKDIGIGMAVLAGGVPLTIYGVSVEQEKETLGLVMIVVGGIMDLYGLISTIIGFSDIGKLQKKKRELKRLQNN